MSVLGQAMGKQRARKKNDFYPTIDKRAIIPLIPFLPAGTIYAEPCAGAGDLMHLLEQYAGLICDWACDIEPHRRYIARHNAMNITEADLARATCFITNPAWTRNLLHPMIRHLAQIAPTWFLFDASWSQTRQSKALGEQYCTDIVSIGRLRWFADTKNDPPDDCSWYRFSTDKSGPTRYHWPVSKQEMDSAAKGQGLLI